MDNIQLVESLKETLLFAEHLSQKGIGKISP